MWIYKRKIRLRILRNKRGVTFALVMIVAVSLLLLGGKHRADEITIDDIELGRGDSFGLFRSPSTTKKVDRAVRHVAFLKVHKTGSSTAQNIFLRFGWNHNLTFVLPPAKNPFGFPNIISLREGPTSSNVLPPPAGKHHEILCNHVIYNRTSFRTYLPRNTFYVGILREPYECFKSTLNYLRPSYIFLRTESQAPGTEYLKDPLKYEPKKSMTSYTNNRMAVELGCPDSLVKSKNSDQIMNFIKQTDQDFGLVIIAEMFEESILLLKRYLNWSIKDALYLDKNIAHRKSASALVGPYDRELYKQWATIDYALYDHFYIRLRQQIRKEGNDFDEELLHFAEIRRMTTEFCTATKKYKDATLVVKESKWNEKFELSHSYCILLQKQEMPFVQEIRVRQYGSEDI
ncbi:galactosylceramide sulfotransferase-like isoform X2 [Mya arenaria]|uniref:galactosylceramide sulfotransferase-like isoform X2 n=1 Tax=Mya arenaria TaxID=6604 RepID=UPI0022DEB0C5|nr:galactosylceramide sulfotransferase-like isoform X2 [Mya arenaria]